MPDPIEPTPAEHPKKKIGRTKGSKNKKRIQYRSGHPNFPGGMIEEEYVELVAHLMAAGETQKRIIKFSLNEEFPITKKLSHRTFEAICSRARAKNLAVIVLTRPRDELVQEQYNFIRTLYADPTAKSEARLNAAESINRLLGLRDELPRPAAAPDPTETASPFQKLANLIANAEKPPSTDADATTKPMPEVPPST